MIKSKYKYIVFLIVMSLYFIYKIYDFNVNYIKVDGKVTKTTIGFWTEGKCIIATVQYDENGITKEITRQFNILNEIKTNDSFEVYVSEKDNEIEVGNKYFIIIEKSLSFSINVIFVILIISMAINFNKFKQKFLWKIKNLYSSSC